MASCPSLSLAVVQPGGSPDPEEPCDPPPLNKGARSGYGCSHEHQALPDWTLQNGAAEKLNKWEAHPVLGQGHLVLNVVYSP